MRMQRFVSPLIAFLATACLADSAYADILNGLRSWYRFDGNLNDSSGNGFHGSVNGPAEYVPGASGQAIRLNGLSGVDIGPNVYLPRFTAAAFVRRDENSGTANGAIITNWSSAIANNFLLSVENFGGSTLWFRANVENGGPLDANIQSQTAVIPGVLYHAAITFDGGTLRLYVNGNLEGQRSFQGLGLNHVIDTRAGVFATGSEPHRGILDDVRIYDRALSAVEIQELTTPELFNISGHISATGPFTLRRRIIADGFVASADDSGNYTLVGLPGPASYTLRAFVDINGNGQRDAWEPEGTYASNPVLLNANLQGINITISQSAADTDNDGMADGWENEFGLNVGTNDTLLDKDGDGLSNLQEYYFGSKPNQTYSAGDDLSDAVRYDAGSSPLAADSDGDGLPDKWELINGVNPLVNDAAVDPDGDGLTNLEEYNAGTNPQLRHTNANDGFSSDYEKVNGSKFAGYTYDADDRLIAAYYDNGGWESWRYDGNGNIRAHRLKTVRDADGDSLPDAWEFSQGLAINNGLGSQGVGGDPDGDGWTNYQEFLVGTDPNSVTSHPPAVGVSGAAWFNPPKARIIFPPTIGGGIAAVNVKTWDAEANPAQLVLQWFNAAGPGGEQWKNATIMRIDGVPVVPGATLATLPTGIVHDFRWNTRSDLGSYNATVLLRITAQDAAGTTISETMPYLVDNTGDTDDDGLPNAWEVLFGLNQNDANGINGSTGDPDFDGFTNLEEFGYGLDPHSFDLFGAPTITAQVNPADGKKYFTVTYRRRTDAPSLIYEIQTTMDMITWTTASADLEPVSVTPITPTLEAVTVRVPPPIGSLGTPRKFVRVQVRSQ